MVLHAGLSALFSSFSFHITFYDTDTKIITEFDFGNKISTWEIFFENVKSKFTGSLGCCCVTSSFTDGDDRKSIMECALKIGFKKVKITEQTTAIYLYAVCYSNYIPKNEDVIWIYDNTYWYIWHRQNQKAKFILSKYSTNYSKKVMEEIFQRSNLVPNVILYRHKFDEASAKEVFPKCEFFEYVDVPSIGSQNFWNTSCYKGALIQARIMADDSEMIEYNANSTLSEDLCMITKKFNDIQWFWKKLSKCKTKKEELEIHGIQRYHSSGETLPITKTAIIHSNNNKNILSVITGTEEIYYSICLPLNKKFAATLNVDENGISHVDIKILEKTESKLLWQKYSMPKKLSVDDTVNRNRAVGIDLGTTRCCAAVYRRRGIEAIALDNTGERLLPSYVAYDEEKEKCGKIVIQRLRNHAKSSIFDSKRIIGKAFNQIAIDENWPFKIIQNDNLKLEHLNEDQLMQFKILENNDTFIAAETRGKTILKHPEEISAVLLKHIKQKVEEYQGRLQTQVMITVPTTFTDAQKDSTCAAAILAGFKIVNFIPEPVAAAFAYLINQPQKNDKFNFLLFDLGGGTLDVCIFKCEKNEIEILSQSGNPNLGGRDFDNILMDFFSKKLSSEFGLENLSLKKHKLMLECQNVKENLSINDKESLQVDDFDPSSEGIIEITREKFEKLSKKLLEKVKYCVKNALGEFSFNQMDKVLLVGGGSRMPMIKNLLQTLFIKSEFCCAEHPDEIVAVGAAYYSYYLESLLKLKNFNSNALKMLKTYKAGKRKNLTPLFIEDFNSRSPSQQKNDSVKETAPQSFLCLLFLFFIFNRSRNFC